MQTRLHAIANADTHTHAQKHRRCHLTWLTGCASLETRTSSAPLPREGKWSRPQQSTASRNLSVRWNGCVGPSCHAACSEATNTSLPSARTVPAPACKNVHMRLYTGIRHMTVTCHARSSCQICILATVDFGHKDISQQQHGPCLCESRRLLYRERTQQGGVKC